jgi:phosphate transport system substrate-binding protein
VRPTVAFALLLLGACGSSDASVERRDGGAGRRADLTGAGATLPYPLYSRWIADHERATGVRINYQSIGSGGGIRQLSEMTVDFGSTDSPMTDAELSKAKGGAILHIPMALGAIVVAYNLPGVTRPLRLDGPLVADIFLGHVSRWDDARLRALNPGVALPARDILVVRRSDGSGTTFVFTDFLASTSAAWAKGPGRGKEVRWPTGLGAKGNEGIAGQIKLTTGSIGYTELAYAKHSQLAVAHLRNASGRFIEPTIEAVGASAEAFAERLPESTDYRVSLMNAPGDHAYPISSFTWILLYREQHDATKGHVLVDFLRWALTSGAESARRLEYAPIPLVLVERLLRRLDEVRPAGTT